MNKPCVERDCSYYDGYGGCLVLERTGGNKKNFCTFYVNHRTKMKCKNCFYAEDYGKASLFCEYKKLYLFPGKDACSAYMEEE